MNRKKLVVIAAVVVAIVIAAAAAIPLFIDTQSLKGKLVAEAERVLRRRMSVQSVDVTIFTGLGVRLNRVVIFDDLRFARAPFISLSSATVRPRLLPLLRGNVEVASIELNQPEIRLIQNQQGAWNFQSIGTTPAGPAGKIARTDASAPSTRSKPSQSFAIKR